MSGSWNLVVCWLIIKKLLSLLKTAITKQNRKISQRRSEKLHLVHTNLLNSSTLLMLLFFSAVNPLKACNAVFISMSGICLLATVGTRDFTPEFLIADYITSSVTLYLHQPLHIPSCQGAKFKDLTRVSNL